MKRKAFFSAAALLTALCLLTACTNTAAGETVETIDKIITDESRIINVGAINFEYTERDLDGSYDEASATSIRLNGDTADVNGTGASASGGVVTISGDGVYILSGTLNDGQIIVEAGAADKVQLVLNGVYIYSSTSAPIYIKSADKVFITLAAGTENTIEDSDSYLLDENEEPSGAIFSKSDLTINGSGALTVNANFNNGIHSKDDLKITDGTITVASAGDGLKGRDCVAVGGGNISVYAAGDGIQSNNAEDAARGFVSIDGGTLYIQSELDGVQAETILQITGGDLAVVSGGGAGDGVNAEANGTFGMERPNGFGFNANAAAESAGDSVSQKGLKGVSGIFILGGNTTVSSADDSVHSNGDIQITDGVLMLTSGDDGIHADSSIVIDGGIINITNSYEGIESANITVNGGDISLTASDDGFNAAGGNDGSAMGGRMGQNSFDSSENYFLSINGGNIYVNASGDGLDSNGLLSITGGTTYVDGPTNDGNGPLDYTTSSVSGGTLVAVGSAGMALNLSGDGQCSLLYVYSEQQSAGSEITLSDESGSVLVSYTPAKQYRCALITTPLMSEGATYTVGSEDTALSSVTMTSASLSVYQNGEAVGGGMMGGGFGGEMQTGTPPEDAGLTPPSGGTPPDGFGGGIQKPERG